MKFILGKKLKMSQIFKKDGTRVPVTLIDAGPCVVTQKKEKEKDGYESIQIGYEEITKDRKIKKTMKGKAFKHLREFRGNVDDYKEGDKIDVSQFEIGEKVKVTGKSKGKGFQGVVKRHDFSGQSRTHGTKKDHRIGGSIGSAYPQRVIKGRKMPGHTGAEKVTISNLKIEEIDKENNILAVKGGVPGAKGTLLKIEKKV
ncbi:MAG: 50S ribosomal protein L3 [Minisyncoccales bacterium]